MSSFVNNCASWFQRNVGWSNSWQSWQERVAFFCWLTGVIAVLCFRADLSAELEVVLWTVLVLVLAIFSRRGLIKLFGPVLFYDLVRTARRSRYFFIRTAYGVLMLFVLFCVFLAHDSGGTVPANRMAEFAASFFVFFMAVQYAFVLILTPAYTAGAIADEKERKTLEFILATDLRNREIVLSKLVSRLANLTLLVLTGLPILAMLQFIGGIDPDHVLAGFAATGLTAASLAALSILWSVHSRKPRDAIILAYLTAIAYVIVGSLLKLAIVLLAMPGWDLLSGTPLLIANGLADSFNAGNPLMVVIELAAHWGRQTLGDTMFLLLRNFAIFHGVAIAVCTALSVWRVRAVALKESSTSTRKTARSWRVKHRPPVGNSPMLWKEILAEPGFRFHWLGRIIVYILVVVSFIPALTILCYALVTFLNEGFPTDHSNYYYSRYSSWDRIGMTMNTSSVRPVGTIVACFLLLSVAVRASTSITSERERETFDTLLTTPMDSDNILFSKWLGSLLSVRWAWLWLGAIWGLGVIGNGLHIVALPLLLAAWLVFAAFVASLGIFFSVVSRSSLRSVVWTLLTITILAFGHWMLTLCCGLLTFFTRSGREFEFLLKFQAAGLTPPFTLGLLALQGKEIDRDYGRSEFLEFIAYALMGLAFWAGGAVALWFMASYRFRQMTGRTDVRYPERTTISSERRPPALL